MNKYQNVLKQYQSDDNLSNRISLHEKNSENKYGFYNFLHDNYSFFPGMKLLELGCGNGKLWDVRWDCVPEECNIVLSDISSGMLESINRRIINDKRIEIMKIDIRNIPFYENTFDFVIANHMLYHVNDLDKALSEVSRVLKKQGVFYASTNDAYGIRYFLDQILQDCLDYSGELNDNYSFNLQNGNEILKRHFTKVDLIVYNDALIIKDPNEMISWIDSIKYISHLPSACVDYLHNYFSSFLSVNKQIRIPKRSGVFIASNQ